MRLGLFLVFLGYRRALHEPSCKLIPSRSFGAAGTFPCHCMPYSQHGALVGSHVKGGKKAGLLESGGVRDGRDISQLELLSLC